MTVHELIKELSCYDQDMEVYIMDFDDPVEGGVSCLPICSVSSDPVGFIEDGIDNAKESVVITINEGDDLSQN